MKTCEECLSDKVETFACKGLQNPAVRLYCENIQNINALLETYREADRNLSTNEDGLLYDLQWRSIAYHGAMLALEKARSEQEKVFRESNGEKEENLLDKLDMFENADS